MLKRILPKGTFYDELPKFRLVMVGCGGTGSFLAGHLARLMAGSVLSERIASVTFVDGDVVEPKNVGRQLFSKGDVGKNKAEVLSNRYNMAYRVEFQWCPEFLTEDNFDTLISHFGRDKPTLVMGCLDTAEARRLIYYKLDYGVWWLDAGNAEFDGQVVLGSTKRTNHIQESIGEYLVEYLPYPPLVYPDLIDEIQDVKQPLSCAEMLLSEEQSLNVNAFAAGIMSEMLRLFLAGELTYNSVQFDLKNFLTCPNLVTDDWLRSFVSDEASEIEDSQRVIA